MTAQKGHIKKRQEAQLLQRDRATHYVMLINSCFISRGMAARKVSNSKRDLQGHWQWCHSIGRIRFPIGLPLQPCLYLAPFPRYYHLFPKT